MCYGKVNPRIKTVMENRPFLSLVHKYFQTVEPTLFCLRIFNLIVRVY